MYSELTIFKKGLTLIATPLLVQAVFIGILIKVQADSAEAQRWAIHTKEVIANVEEMRLGLVESYAGIRDLIFSGTSSLKRPSWDPQEWGSRQIEDLRTLVSDNPQQQSRVSELATQSSSLLSWLAAQKQLVHSGQRGVALDRVDQGARLLDEVRMTIGVLLREEERLDRDREEALRRSGSQQLWTLIGGGVTIVVSTLILALLFLKGIVQRLAILRDNARRLSEGKALKASLAGRDEITEVDRAFHDMADQLNQQKQENEMFVYSVSHDLRSPLVNLQGFSEELNLSCRDLQILFQHEDVPAAVRQRGLKLMRDSIEESIHFIQTAVGRLARIIDALLRLSRAGRVVYQWQAVDTAMVVQKIIEALHDTISAKKAEVTVGMLPPTWGDPTAVEQVFANLIGNAVQYLDPARPGRIEVGNTDDTGLSTPAGLQVYYVKDNGLGIPESYHRRMFTAFNGLHANLTQGEGIGLALTCRVVERHGGRIWLESSAGVGTTFFVALPACPGNGTDPNTGERILASLEPRGDRLAWQPSRS
jgi:signal transduction histidine kinase